LVAREIDEFSSRLWKKSNAHRLERLQCRFETNSYLLSAALNQVEADRQEIYARIIEPNDSPSSFAHNDDERVLLAQLENLTWNVLAFLSLAPIEYEPERIERKARTEGEHLIPALIRARFVGESQLRAIRRPKVASPPDKTTTASERESVTIPRSLHWTAGHWRKQVCGVGRAERRLTCVQPYRAGKDNQSEVE
jgi:hypothetical protein